MIQNLSIKFAVEWAGCLTGLLGAFVLALNLSFSGWGWVLFLMSNVFWIAYGMITRAKGIVLMQIGFACTSTLGMVNTFIH